MKHIAENIDNALTFEAWRKRKDAKLRASLLEQAAAYRKLAKERSESMA